MCGSLGRWITMPTSYDEGPPDPNHCAARCSICNANFPIEMARKMCPICQEEELDGIRDLDPDDPEELADRVKHAKFDRYLEATGRA